MNFRDKETLMYNTKEGEASSSTRQWSSRLKNPRIVRMSRTFGGKDRHSKVCTIKGLRDRRIRLSVPTAIQLYDLQDRLGLNQPSKVIDWLLDVTKHDIDELPPLPGIPGCFGPFQQALHAAQGYGMSLSSSDLFFDANMISSRRDGVSMINSNLNMGVNEDLSIEAKLRLWDSRRKKIEDDNDQDAIMRESDTRNSQVLAQNLFPITSDGGNASVILPQNPSNLLRNHQMYNYNHLYLEPSNLSLTQLGSNNNGVGLSSYYDHHHQGNNSSNSSSLPPPLLGQSSMATPSLNSQQASYNHHLQFESDIRQLNRFTLSNNHIPSSMYTSTSLGLKPFPLSMSHLHQSGAHREDKDDDDSPWI